MPPDPAADLVQLAALLVTTIALAAGLLCRYRGARTHEIAGVKESDGRRQDDAGEP